MWLPCGAVAIRSVPKAGTPDTCAVHLHGVYKRFGDRRALDGIDLCAQYGEVHGLLGPNGAGKTTLLRVVLGLIRRDAGSVFLLGRPMQPAGDAVPESVAGFVETPAFYPYLSARANLALLARLDGRAGDGMVVDLLQRVGLSLWADQTVSGYSTGMRQRLGIAAALLRRPRVLLVDEPTSSLDPAGAREVRALIRGLANDGVCVVFSSHDMAEVEELCSTLTIIDRGRLVYAGTVSELRATTAGPAHLLRTSDDEKALEIGRQLRGLSITASGDGSLEVSCDVALLDAFVIALGRAGVAVRSLEHRVPTLESLFLDLTDRAGSTPS